MAGLPIRDHTLLWNPTTAPGGDDTYSWRVFYGEGDESVVVQVSGSTAIETGLSSHELHEALPVALQRYARGRLTSERHIAEQVSHWDAPVVLGAEHFR